MASFGYSSELLGLGVALFAEPPLRVGIAPPRETDGAAEESMPAPVD